MSEHIYLCYARARDAVFAEKLSDRLKKAGFSVWYSSSVRADKATNEITAQAISNCWIIIFIVTPKSVDSAPCQQELNMGLSQRKLVVPVILQQSDLPPRLHHRRSIPFTGEFEASVSQLTRYLTHLKGSDGNIQALRDLLVDLEGGFVPELSGYPELVRSEIETLRLQLRANAESVKGPVEGVKGPVPFEKTTKLEMRDWDNAPDISDFFGREKELSILKDWVDTDKCRLVGILGMGGIGKTVLVTKLAQEIGDGFDYIIWRSLRNAPPLEELLEECIVFLSGQKEIDRPGNLSNRVSLLIDYFRANRCLVLLDNFESVLLGGADSGVYREGYEGYGQLIQQVGETAHKSLLLLTSREKPKEFARLEGSESPVRILLLSGIDEVDGQAILKDKGIAGLEETWEQLIKRYSGNLLVLKLASETIRELYEGNIAAFLSEGEAIFGDVLEVLEEQFIRLSKQEQEIMYWLAIEREPVNADALRRNLISHPSKGSILESLAALRHRSLIERSSTGFTLQNVILEYVTNRLTDNVCQEIERKQIFHLANYALIQAQAREYVRQSQTRLILEPIVEELLASKEKASLEVRLGEIIALLRKSQAHKPSYAAGNILNLLVHLQTDLTGFDFSNLSVWEAFVQGVNLSHTNFADCDLTTSVFTETFRRVLTVGFSPDGSMLVAGTSDRKAIVWRLADFKQILTCEGHDDLVRCVAVSCDNNLLASGSSDRTVRLWDIARGVCSKILRGHEHMVNAVAFSPDGTTLASSSGDWTVRLWDTESGEEIRSMKGHTGFVSSVAYSPLGDILASGSEDRTIRLWNVASGDAVAMLNGHSSRILPVAFSPDGRILASGGADNTVRLWNVATKDCFAVLQGHLDYVWSVDFNNDGKLLASGSQDQTIRIWQVETGECVRVLQGHQNHVRSVAFNNNSGVLASGGRDSTVRIWDVTSAHALKTLQGYSNSVWAVTFSSDKKTLASGNNDHNVYLWDVLTGQIARILHGHTNSVGAVAFSPEGKTLASGSEDRTIRMWDRQTGKCIRILQGHTSWVNSVTYNHDGRLLASCGEDNTIRLWDAASGQALRILQGHSALVWTVNFSPDGSTLASCSEDSTIRLWDVDTGQQLIVLEAPTDHMIFAVTFSPDGRMIASSGTDRVVRLWDAATGDQLREFFGHTMLVMSVAFSPDGGTLASSSVDQTVRLWDVLTGECVKVLRGHSGQIDSVEFSPDGQLLASGSADETIRVWKTDSGALEMTLKAQRLCEGMNITGVTGLTQTQKTALKTLGAVERA